MISNMFYIIVSLSVLILLLFKYFHKPPRDIKGKHVLITGGSSGIGLSAAHEALKLGAKVTILARNQKSLDAAEKELNATVENLSKTLEKRVQTISVDVTGSRSSLCEMLRDCESVFGPVYMLINCAGVSRSARFEDLSEDDVKNMINVNYLGSFFLTQEVVRSMKREDGGVIVFVSSQAGLFGLYGYTAYSASKGAVIKMAEALHMELKPYNIDVNVNVPPDTDTPGFNEENKTKPLETKLISASAGLFEANYVARNLIADALKGKFYSTVGLEGFMLTTLGAGMSPITDCISFVSQVFLAGLFRSVSAFYLWNFSSIVRAEHENKSQSKKKE